TTLTALAKLEQVLPSALRRRVNALAGIARAFQAPGAAVSPEVLGQLALACRDRERLRFHYVAADGRESDRVVEPHSLVSGGRSWFLVAWDLHRDAWRTFRVDRLSAVFGTRVAFPERELPGDDAAEFVRVAMNSMPTPLQAAVILDMPLAEMEAHFGPWARFSTAESPTTTRWPIGGDTLQDMFYALAWIPPGVGYRIDGNDEFARYVREVGGRMTAV
ncbi:MAG TPA: WYL domain-containing protein, partial [Rhodoglobus sp.]|nr:WYL domain-containing protein [Rhodoglobus sp.]